MPLSKKRVVSEVQKHLLQKAIKRYIDEGESISGDIESIKELPKHLRREAKSMISVWLNEEKDEINVHWDDFRNIINDLIDKALNIVIANSNRDWYAMEKFRSTLNPDAIAVPLGVLRYKCGPELIKLIAAKIEFQKMRPETRRALALNALDEHFENRVHQARRKYFSYKIGVYNYTIVDLIEDDFYYLNDFPDVFRIDMVILYRHEVPLSLGKQVTKEVEKSKKSARKEWDEFNKSPSKRRDERRFKDQNWNLPQGFLESLAH